MARRCKGRCDALMPFKGARYRTGLRFCAVCGRSKRVKGNGAVKCPCCGGLLRFNSSRRDMRARAETGTAPLALPAKSRQASWSDGEREQYRAYHRRYYAANIEARRAASRESGRRLEARARKREYLRRPEQRARRRAFYVANRGRILEAKRARPVTAAERERRHELYLRNRARILQQVSWGRALRR